MATKYTFGADTYEFKDHHAKSHRASSRQHRRHNSRGGDSEHGDDPLDGSGSLTYSAASSINSAGESTDSSFAEIMKVLAVEDSKDIAAFLKKDAMRTGKDEKSVAESLAYSTDAESHMRSLATDAESGLHGADLVSTFTGQASDQKYDGGAYYSSASPERDEPDVGGNGSILFSAAEHESSMAKRRKDSKRRKHNKLQQAHSKKGADTCETPRVKNGNGIVIESRQGTPPSSRTRPPKSLSQHHHSSQHKYEIEEEDVWYAKWWMFCFPDTVNNMTERR